MKFKDTADLDSHVEEGGVAQTDPLDTDFPCYVIIDGFIRADGRFQDYVTQDGVYLKPGLNVDPRCFDLWEDESFWKAWEGHAEDEDMEGADGCEVAEAGSGNLAKVLDAAKVLVKHVHSQIDQYAAKAKRHPDHGFVFYKEDILAALQPSDCYLCEVEVPSRNFIKINSGESTRTWKSPVIYVGKPKKITKQVIRSLIKRGANVRACQDAPLVYAAESGDASLVSLLLKHGADPHVMDSQAFFNALDRGDLAVVSAFLSTGFDVHYAEERPLRWAALKGDIEGVELMLKFGADVHVQDVYHERHERASYEDRETPLGAAARGGSLHVFTRLLDVGADLSLAIDSVLEAAAEANDVKMINHVVRSAESQGLEVTQGHTMGAFNTAVHQGNVAATKALLVMQAPKAEDARKLLSCSTRGSGLADALNQQHTEMFDYLLTNFAWAQDELSDALGDAIRQGNYEAMKVLFKAGADPSYVNYGLFGIAADCGNIKAIHIMAEILKIREANEIPAGVGVNNTKEVQASDK